MVQQEPVFGWGTRRLVEGVGGLCLMHGGLQHVHSSSMGIQPAHIGCESHSDERGSSRGRRKSKTIADTRGPGEQFRFVEGKRREGQCPPQLLARPYASRLARQSACEGDQRDRSVEAERRIDMPLSSLASGLHTSHIDTFR